MERVRVPFGFIMQSTEPSAPTGFAAEQAVGPQRGQSAVTVARTIDEDAR